MSKSETSALTNFVWQSLTGAHQHLAVGDGRARRYHADVSPFAALEVRDARSLKDLAELVPVGDLVLLRDEVPEHDGEWITERTTPALQMIFPIGAAAYAQRGLRRLETDDVPAMLELAELVLPGYLRKRCLEMGSFFGIYENERLVAMTGERVFPKPYREITAVCTHPDFQGKGYAARLVEHVTFEMLEENHRPFLHVGVNNSRAIALYKRLGFIENGQVPLFGIRRL